MQPLHLIQRTGVVRTGLLLAVAGFALPLPAFAACGDGIREAGEGCDDGNIASLDGCSALCSVEPGFTCRTQPHVDVANASFETNPFPSVGMTTGGGWTRLTMDDVDWVSDASLGGGTSCWPAGEGHLTIDMNGSGRQGTMFQTFTTVPGQHYVMSFLGNANSNDGTGLMCDTFASKDLTVRVADGTDFMTASQARVFTLVHPLNVRNNWVLQYYEFDALSTTTTLVFQGSSPSSNGPMIDRIAIPDSVCTVDTCGNGIVTALTSEMCDDGNQISGDGCSATCALEPGYTCATPGAACTATTCSDGIVATPEQCDDRNNANGDGCSATCTIEPGWVCPYDGIMARSVCTMTCGNGTTESGEQCDDANANDLDACSNNCLLGPSRPCVADVQCQLGLCPPGAGSLCAGCYDSAGPGALDFGCTAALPACNTTAAFPICVQCLASADCAATDTCNDVSHTCVPRDDAGMDAGSDAGVDGGADAGADAGSDAGNDSGIDGGRDAASLPDVGSDAAPDAGPRNGGASGGACFCAMHARSTGSPWRAGLALAVIALVLRRRRP